MNENTERLILKIAIWGFGLTLSAYSGYHMANLIKRFM